MPNPEVIKKTYEDFYGYYKGLDFSDEHAHSEAVNLTAGKYQIEEKEVNDVINVKVQMEDKDKKEKILDKKTLSRLTRRKGKTSFNPDDFSGDNPYAGRRHGRREEHVLGGENESRRKTMKRGFDKVRSSGPKEGRKCRQCDNPAEGTGFLCKECRERYHNKDRKESRQPRMRIESIYEVLYEKGDWEISRDKYGNIKVSNGDIHDFPIVTNAGEVKFDEKFNIPFLIEKKVREFMKEEYPWKEEKDFDENEVRMMVRDDLEGYEFDIEQAIDMVIRDMGDGLDYQDALDNVIEFFNGKSSGGGGGGEIKLHYYDGTNPTNMGSYGKNSQHGLIVIDSDKNAYMNNSHEVLDGNHRLAYAIQNGIKNIPIYSVNYEAYMKKFGDKRNSNDTEHDKWVKKNGTRINAKPKITNQFDEIVCDGMIPFFNVPVDDYEEEKVNISDRRIVAQRIYYK